MAQIIPIVSEALQATIRRLLPSQRGFGEDLQASNVVVPIVDLTPTAEGSILGTNLQTALAFGSQDAFLAKNTTETVANSPGFWRIFGCCSGLSPTGASTADFLLSNGLTNKLIWSMRFKPSTNDMSMAVNFDFVVYLTSGDSLSAKSVESNVQIAGSSRQIADVSGVVVNPAGFVSE